jgi:hypothetical protein
MEFRSTNDRRVHFQGDIVSNVSSGGVGNSSHGIHLTGGSTGGIVTAAGDETNIALNVFGKGTGPLVLGSTGAAAVLNSTTTRIGSASTSNIAMVQRYFVEFTVPALSTDATAGAYAESSVTVTGLTTNSVLVLGQRVAWNSTFGGIGIRVRCSTANSLNVAFSNFGGSTLSGSTMSAYLLQYKF